MERPDITSKRLSPKATVALLMGFASALLFLVFVFEDLDALLNVSSAEMPWGRVFRYTVSMGLAGALVGAFLSGLFGRRGFAGWLIALAAAAIIATVAGILGSFFGRLPDLFGREMEPGDWIAILAGGAVLIWTVADWPLLGLAWLALVGFTHLRVLRLRQSA